MDVKLSTKKIFLSIIDECDLILREFLSVLTSNEENINPMKLLDLLLDKDTELKSLIPKVNEQIKMQRYMDYLKSEIEKRDKMILSCQLHLRKSEIILNTAIYYSRKKLNIISTAVANPVDPEEVIKYGHRITAGHGVVASYDWHPGDKRRPFPTEENIRNGYLGHVDNINGEWMPSLVDYSAANHESRLNAIFGLNQSKESSQPAPSPLQSPRISQQQINAGRTPQQSIVSQVLDSGLHSSSTGSLAQLPPGVNVVSSPAPNLNRGMQMSCSTPNFVLQGSVTPTDHRNQLGPSSAASCRIQQQDEVEVMSDSCSSSSSDGFR